MEVPPMAQAAVIPQQPGSRPDAQTVAVALEGVRITFDLPDGGIYQAVDATDLAVRGDEFVAIVGPGDKDLYIKAVQGSKESYSKDGVITQEGMESMLNMLKTLEPEFASAQIDLGKTFDPQFVNKAQKQ